MFLHTEAETDAALVADGAPTMDEALVAGTRAVQKLIAGIVLTLWQFDTSGVVVNHFANVPRSGGPAIGNNLVIDAGGSLWIAASAQDSTGMLIEAPGLAQGPQYFPYVGPEFPY